MEHQQLQRDAAVRAEATVPDIEAWNHIIGESANGHGESSIEHQQCVIVCSLMFAGKQ